MPFRVTSGLTLEEDRMSWLSPASLGLFLRGPLPAEVEKCPERRFHVNTKYCGVVVHTFNSSSLAPEAGGSL